MGQRRWCLGHNHWQLVETQLSIFRHCVTCHRCKLNAICALHLRRQGCHFFSIGIEVELVLSQADIGSNIDDRPQDSGIGDLQICLRYQTGTDRLSCFTFILHAPVEI